MSASWRKKREPIPYIVPIAHRAPWEESAAQGPWLLGHPVCPYCNRVVIMLRQWHLPFGASEIDFTDKPAWFGAIAPQIPVWWHRSETVVGSVAILQRLAPQERGNTRRPGQDLEPIARVDALHRTLLGCFRVTSAGELDDATRDLERGVTSTLNELSQSASEAGAPITPLGACVGSLLLAVMAAGLAERWPPELSRLAGTWLVSVSVRATDTDRYRTLTRAFLANTGGALATKLRAADDLQPRPHRHFSAQDYVARRTR